MTEMDELLPCPFCGTTEHLSLGAVGSLTGDMPARPYRVACHHVDHDTVSGPVAYGRPAAIAAWNRRPSLSPAGVTEEEVEALTKTFCGDKLNGGVLRDMAFTVWQKCQKPTHEDGNTDWFNDTLPIVDAAVERLRAALEAAAKAQPSAASDGWQDISTAPKDGTMVLLFNAAHGEQAVMGWTADVGLPDAFPEGCWTDVGSRNAGVSLTVNGGYFQYWRPLIAPPVDAKGGA